MLEFIHAVIQLFLTYDYVGDMFPMLGEEDSPIVAAVLDLSDLARAAGLLPPVIR